MLPRIRSLLSAILKRPLAGNSLIYLAGNGAAAAISFLLIPFFTRFLSPSEYGIYSLFMVGVTLSYAVIGLALSAAVARRFVDSDTIEFPVYVSSSVIISSVMAILVLIVALLLRDWIENRTSIPRQIIWVMVIVGYAQSMIAIATNIAVMKHNAFRVAGWKLSLAVLFGISSLVLLLFGYQTWESLAYAQLLAHIVILISGLVWLNKEDYLPLSLRKDYVADAFRYSLPLVPYIMFTAILITIDRFIIANKIGVDRAGIYSVGQQFGMILWLFIASFNQSYIAWFFERMKENNTAARRQIRKTIVIVGILVCGLAVALSLIALLFFDLIVGREFAEARGVIPWIVAGFAMNGLALLAANFLYYLERTVIWTMIMFTAAGTNIALNLILIPKFDIMGAAMSALLAQSCLFVLAVIAASVAVSRYWSGARAVKTG